MTKELNHVVMCMECSKQFKSLSTTHLKMHGLTFAEYKDKYPNAKIKSEYTLSKTVVTLKAQIDKYGIEEGTKRFEQYKEKQAYSNSFEYKQQKHGWSEEKFNQYNQSRACTEENYIKRHGIENGKNQWLEYCNLQSYVGSSKQYFIDLYGDVIGCNMYDDICKRKGMTVENFIRRHGETEGRIKYQTWINTRATSMFYSKISQELFNSIIPGDLSSVYFATNEKGEFSKYDKDNKRVYFYDYVDLKHKKCIEFNGDVFHANPKFYSSTDTPNFRNKSQTSQEIWENDKQKIKTIEDTGINVLVIWENDYKHNMKETILKCKEFVYGQV